MIFLLIESQITCNHSGALEWIVTMSSADGTHIFCVADGVAPERAIFGAQRSTSLRSIALVRSLLRLFVTQGLLNTSDRFIAKWTAGWTLNN
jgi:hypothetical protein